MMIVEDFINDFVAEKIVLPKQSNFGAAILETRKYFNIDRIINNHINYLPNGTGLTFFHSTSNEVFIKQKLAHYEGINFININPNDRRFGANEYNTTITSTYFWNKLPYKKVLIFQTDSCLLRKGIEKFLEWDYIGAPWAHIKIEGGNGGLSIRNVELCKKIINSYEYSVASYGNEDLYFSRHIPEFGKVAPKEIAKKFSVETIYYDKPIGIHACWKYLSKEQVIEIINKAE